MTNEADKPSVEGLTECLDECRRYPASKGARSMFIAYAKRLTERLASAAAPAARPATPLREVLSDEPDPETRGYLRGHREMSDYHTAAMKDAYGLLGIDGSDGEYRYKWVALEISNLKAALLAASSDEARKA